MSWRRGGRRRLWIAAASILFLILLLAGTSILVLQSQWFFERVRRKIVSAVESATGGRVEIERFSFAWKQLRAEVRGFTLHGTEPQGKPPLFHSPRVVIGLKIVSIFKRDIDIQYLDVNAPHIYLIVRPDGSTNIPEPILKRKRRNVAETILDLAIGRFNLENGLFEVESRYRTPFSARGRKLNAHFDYEAATPLYRGNLTVEPLDLSLPDRPMLPVGVRMALTFEKNRAAVTAGNLTTGNSEVDLKGTIDDFTNPRFVFRYDARVRVTDAAAFLRVPQLKGGSIQAGGNLRWVKGPGLSITGNFHAANLEYRDASVRLRDWSADGSFTASERGVDLSGLRLSGLYLTNTQRIPIQGQIAAVDVRGSDLDLRGVALGVLGGNFRGDARIRNFDRVSIVGEIANFEARKTLAMYSTQKIPWDARVSGTVRVETSLKHRRDLRAVVNLALAPAPDSAPVYGRITANYDAALGTIELGRSTITLPSSRADFSGTLGRELRVHAETRNLEDILPVAGIDITTFPVRIDRGPVIFDGTVTGPLDRPYITGHVDVTGVSYSGTAIDSLSGDVTASPDNLRLERATIKRGTLSARFQIAVALQEWRTSNSSQIFGEGTIDQAEVPDLLALAGRNDVPATGTLRATARLTGTIGDPQVNADVDVSKGSYADEPFDRLTARVRYAGNLVEVAQGQITAGPRLVRLTASYTHAPNRFDTGRLHFDVDTNNIPLEQIRAVQRARPDVRGTVQVTGRGEVDVAPAAGGGVSVRPVTLQGEMRGQNLQVANLPLGSARLTANSQGPILRTHLEAAFADSQVRGEGEWRLEGNYPGSATVTFTRLDLAQVRSWLAPTQAAAIPARFTGYAEGELRITGEALRSESLRAELRLPRFSIGAAQPAGAPSTYALENNGPIVAALANGVVTIESARLKGRETDLAVTGRVNLREKTPLDLRVDGRIGLDILRDFNADIQASGVATADATIRGELASPQINGRLQLQNAALSIADVPSGISELSGTILFNGERATIQNLTGETGGGRVSFTGFVAYREGEADFNIGVKATEVRVRYPEGVSTTANANLTLTGTTERSLLAGSVTVLRTGFNPRSDFSALLALSREPLRTPAARTGFLGGMSLDVQISTDPDIQFQSFLTQDLQVDGSVKLRGTAGSPGMLGRINITQGQVVFYGTKYTISQGSISFYNPSKIEPILDIDLETRARGIDITLTVSGPLDKLNLTPRSDPPMQFSEIVALLATGRAPSTDATLLAQTTPQQSWQQMGASALLGSVVASPVSGRLQRLFGVSQLRIDPTLSGVENNLQARLTLEQQVTPDITFTYITSVTTSNPQVVRMEWAINRQWSVVALREENGVFGIDFFFKRRF